MEAGDAAATSSCYTSGSVAGAVFGTLLTVLVLAGLAYLFWRFYWRRRRGKHLTLETGEKGDIPVGADGPLGDRFAFDNPCFLSEDASPNRKNKKGAPKIKADGTQGKAEKNVKSDKGGGTGRLGKWTSWSPLGALVGTGGTNAKGNDKRRAFDDSCVGEPERVSVSLRGHDFTGLGFNVCGNMRDGIFVRDVLHRGPASESGQIAAGDRIVSLGISFEHMVFEDALTILSYASPYEVLLQVEKGASPPGSTLLAGTDISSGQTSLKRTAASTKPSEAGVSNSPDKQRAIICHPFYRSQSIDDLDKIGKASINAKRAQQIAEMTRVKSNTQDEMNHGSNKGGIAEVDGRNHHKDVEDERLQRREAPSEEDTKKDGETGSHHTGYQKFGVRVLPMGNPSAGTHVQGVGKVHNPVHQNSSPVGSRPDRAEEVSITIATPEPQKQNERNSMIEMGVGKDMKVVASPHNPTDDNPSSKPTHNVPDSNNPTEESVQASETEMKMQETKNNDGAKKPEEGTKNPHSDKEVEKVEMREKKLDRPDKISTGGMIIDVPEEVCMAAMAAVTNRKMGGLIQQNKVEEEEVTKQNGRAHYNSGGSGDEGSEDGDRVLSNTPGNGGKRRAPAPPLETLEMNPGDSEVVTPVTSEVTMEEDTPLCIPVSEERKKKGGTRIELGLDHITIHHQPQPTEEMIPKNNEEGEAVPMESAVSKEEKDTAEGDNSMTTGEENSSDTEADDAPTAKRTVTTVTGGKAASLGDLSRLEGGEVHRPPRMRAGPSSVTGAGEGVVLERAVSLDLGNAEEVVTCPAPTTSIGSAKKRKAPAPPTPVSRGNSNGSDEIDGSSRGDTGLDGDAYGKEPRLIGVGTTDTFGRRLKKSSDWGTMEEALLAGGSPSSSSTSSSTSAGRTILHLGSVPSFIPLSTSDEASHNFGNLTSEVSTTRNVETPQGGSELMASMLKKIHSQPEISLQSSVITSSDTDGDANAMVTSTSEMPKTNNEQMSPSSSAGGSTVIVTTSASIEEAIDSTTYPNQQNSHGVRGIVHLEAADTANSYIGGEGDKAEPSGESFQSSFQRAREFFEREDDKSTVTPMEENNDDDDEITSSPPSLPTSPIPTMQPSSPLSLHSTTTYISSIEDIPVVPGLLDSREFGVTAHSAPGSQHHITEIQVTSIDEDGKKVETREVVVSQEGDEAFGRVGDIISNAIERNSLGSSGEKFSVAPMKIPHPEGELQSNMYINDSFPAKEASKATHRIAYKLTTNMSESHYPVGKPSSSLTDNGSIEMSTHVGPIVGSSDQIIEEMSSVMDTISGSEIVGDAGSPIVQIRMREGPSGWIPYRHRNSQGEERVDGKKEILDGGSEPPKVPKKKPPVPPRKDASNSSSESPNRSDSNLGSSYSSSVKTVVEVPMSFTKRLVQVHETRSDDGIEEMEGRQEQPMHRISEREVIQITPQELDKAMMSHSQFLSHKRGESSPSKSEQWIPGAVSTRSVVHRIVEKWVTDEDGMRKIITETSVGEGGETVTEVIESEGGNASPPNGIVSTVPDSNALEGASELHKQSMSVTRILVDPEFASNLGRSSDGVTKTVNVANLQLSGIEGKPSIPPSGLQT